MQCGTTALRSWTPAERKDNTMAKMTSEQMARYGWTEPPHKLENHVYQTSDGYVVTFTLKIFSKDHIEVEDLIVTPEIKGIDWDERRKILASKPKRGLKLSQEDLARENALPYLMRERTDPK